MYVSFIFSFAEIAQQWFNFPEFKEHFIHKKEYCLVFCTEKLLILYLQLQMVKDIWLHPK